MANLLSDFGPWARIGLVFILAGLVAGHFQYGDFAFNLEPPMNYLAFLVGGFCLWRDRRQERREEGGSLDEVHNELEPVTAGLFEWLVRQNRIVHRDEVHAEADKVGIACIGHLCRNLTAHRLVHYNRLERTYTVPDAVVDWWMAKQPDAPTIFFAQ